MTSINPSEFFMLQMSQHRKDLSFCHCDATSLRQWINQLPAIQLGDTSKLLLNAVIEIAELDCDELLRFELIQTLHLSIEQILGILEKHFLDKLYSISSHNTHTIELAQQFRCYLINIYFNISFKLDKQLQAAKFSLFTFTQKKNRQRTRTYSCYYALEQLGRLRYQQVVLYKNALVGQWRIGHQLFKLAEENQFHLQTIEHLNPTLPSLKHIYYAYSQLCLIDILSPQQIRPIEIDALYQCTFQWVKLIQISKHGHLDARYMVYSENDFPPVWNNIHSKITEHVFFIDTQALLEHINLTHLPNNHYISAIERHYLTPSLIFHIQHLLNNMPERRYERYDFNSSIQLTFGLQSAHFYLSHGTAFNETLYLNSKIGVQKNSKALSTWNSEVKMKHHSYQTLDPETKQIYNCNILDISVNGYRMCWDSVPPKQLRAGEFILVQENEKTPWRGGTIRWLKQENENRFEFGVEILSQEITPCAVQLSADQDSTLYHPALILKNEVLNLPHLSIIVLGSQTFKSQQGILLRLGKKQIKIYLTETKLVSQSFTQFNFELLNGDEQVLLDQFIQNHAETMKKQDLWESLK
ncbi:GTPase [Acinetobacter sp. MD2]|nr:GTPase [Acinetobacter sp. MD2]